MKDYSRALRCTFLYLVIGLLITGTCARSQTDTSKRDWTQKEIEVDTDQQSMEQIAVLLSQKTGASILIDGEPVLRAADLKVKGTAQEVLDKFADTFDYSWTLSKSGVALMTKRFRDPEERPQANVPELAESVKNMLSAIRFVPFFQDQEPSITGLLTNLGQSLTPNQVQILLQGQRVRIGDLSPAARRLAEQIIYADFLQGVNTGLLRWRDQLAGLDRSYLHYKEIDTYALVRSDDVLVAKNADAQSFVEVKTGKTHWVFGHFVPGPGGRLIVETLPAPSQRTGVKP